MTHKMWCNTVLIPPVIGLDIHCTCGATEDQMKLIGISGKAGSGKDFLGKNILRPMGYQQWSLAWPMKNEAVGAGFSYEDVHYNKPPEARAFLQQRGTEEGWMKYGKDYWTKIADAWLRTIQEQWNWRKFYVPDVRFEHETDWIKRNGGKLIRLTGRGGLEGAAGQHASETALDDYTGWDIVIDNSTATLTQIREQLFRKGII